MAGEAALYRFRRNWLLLLLPIVILFPTIAVMKLTGTATWEYFDVGVLLAAVAWFLTAWIALRRMFRWQCPACRKPFFGDTRIRLPPFHQRASQDAVTRCASCGTLLGS